MMMGMIKRAAASAAAAAVVATGTVVAGGAALSPASASCALAFRFTAGNIANSEVSYASSGCDGMIAHETNNLIKIKGWYNNGSGWAKSSLPAKVVYAGITQNHQIIGQTVDGVSLKGERVDYNNATVLYTF